MQEEIEIILLVIYNHVKIVLEILKCIGFLYHKKDCFCNKYYTYYNVRFHFLKLQFFAGSSNVFMTKLDFWMLEIAFHNITKLIH